MGIEEAMAAGVPVLASNRCGMPFMVRHGETGFLVDPEDKYDIAARLRLLLDSQSLRETMAVRARTHALERYHPQKVALRTRDVYEEAIRSTHFASAHSRRFDLRNATAAPGSAEHK